MSTESEVADQYAFTEALADIRDDACDINLVVVGHVDGNPNLVNIVHKGMLYMNNGRVANRSVPRDW